MVNAVYHRSYQEREPIEVRVLPDQITITSYPGPDRSIRLSDLTSGKLVPRRYRNRRIGEFLKELHLTEGRGTGIPTAIRALHDNGSPRPAFDTDEDRTYFTATIPIHPEALRHLRLQASIQNSTQVSTQQELFTSPSKVSDKLRIILQFCESPRDRDSILARLGFKSAKNLRTRYFAPLLKDGLLAMTDPQHPNSPAQKYRTTEEGLRFIHEIV